MQPDILSTDRCGWDLWRSRGIDDGWGSSEVMGAHKPPIWSVEIPDSRTHTHGVGAVYVKLAVFMPGAVWTVQRIIDV